MSDLNEKGQEITNLVVVYINDCDWMVGESVEQCVNDYKKHCDPDDVDDAYKLDESELERLTYTDEYGESSSFAERLKVEVAEGGEFPRLFATTEF